MTSSSWGRGFGKDDGGRGSRAKDYFTFLYGFWEKFQTIWFKKVNFIISKLRRSSNWYSGCYLFIKMSLKYISDYIHLTYLNHS